jgi:uncharacterized membrane protein/thiol-disulfide isomerase/thioredoxin
MKMTKKRLQIFFSALLSLGLLFGFSFDASAQATAPEGQQVVQAVLFFSPSCGHCEYVRTEVFPPLFDKYGKQLEIEEIDITTDAGLTLFSQVLEILTVPDTHRGVPFLVIEDSYMVGSEEIPGKFPDLIAEELQGDGTSWPDIPEILEYLQTQNDPAPAAESDPTEAPKEENQAVLPDTEENPSPEPENKVTVTQADDEPDPPAWLVNFRNDLAGNSVAVVVLVGMIIAVVYTGVIFMRGEAPKLWPWWITPVLVILGFGVAAYLSVIEVSGSEALCGPVGDCNAVQSSPYARLFGVIHIGLLGMVGYVVIGLVWAIGRWGKQEWRGMANMAMLAFGVFGTLFSIYLTFLEPFVIGATCMWCISSAIIMTLLMLNATPIALDSWLQFDYEDYDDDFDDDEDYD